jgi:hypothetical protein
VAPKRVGKADQLVPEVGVAPHAYSPFGPPLALGRKDGGQGRVGGRLQPAADRGGDLLGRSTGEDVTGSPRVREEVRRPCLDLEHFLAPIGLAFQMWT